MKRYYLVAVNANGAVQARALHCTKRELFSFWGCRVLAVTKISKKAYELLVSERIGTF